VSDWGTWIVLHNIIVSLLLSLGGAPILVWMERRIAGLIQDRPGPNRCHIGGVRLFGIVQSLADVFKLVFKEDFKPLHVKESTLYTLAPVIVFVCAFLTFMVMPLADDLVIEGKSYIMQALPIEFGLLWFLALAGLAVYGILLGGWASDNKYGMLGALRASAQVISYEASMGLALVSMLIVYGSIHLNAIVQYQSELIFGFIPAWGIVLQPIAAIIFIITAFAETNRAPFDMAEGESEIVGGFHTEYSAMRFGLFFVGEYVAMCASSALIVTLFFGGYNIPWLSTEILKTNLDTVLIVLAAIIPFLAWGFIGWMERQNQWLNPNDPRAKETRILKRIIIGITTVLVIVLAGMWLVGLNETGKALGTASLQMMSFALKVYAMNFVFIWVRWTLPRFRYDQLQYLGWKILLPLALANVAITAIVVIAGGF
jgi:NADH-quinone oxidoreductase subunit H